MAGMTNLLVSTDRSDAQRLEAAISDRTAVVAIVGQGYVGLPLAMAVASAGFRTIGFDPFRAATLNAGESHIPDVPSEQLRRLIDSDRYEASAENWVLKLADVIVVCVPTPLHGDSPDLSYNESAAKSIARQARPGTLVVLESTTYPGTTEEVLLPLIVNDERVPGETLFVAFSPERIDPGNEKFGLKNTPKVVGGADAVSGELAAAFYGTFVDQVVRVPGTREAEMAKLIENTFRHVNIALMNELAVFCGKAGIDVNAAIRAAASKPFGYMPFFPGPGVGGHCIPVDPNYLAWQFRQAGERFKLVETAEEINGHMPNYVARRIQDLLNEGGIPLRSARILVVGAAYKPNINDWRESPTVPLVELLHRAHADIVIVDPHVDQLPTREGTFPTVTLDEALSHPVDLAVIVTPHDDIDYQAIIDQAHVVYDTRAFLTQQKPNIHTL
jgi:UDP-N-acetyl-D-glucosamine dehydrogenase